MNTVFVKALAKLIVFVTVITALLFIGVGILFLLFPQLIWTALAYTVGVGLILIGLLVIVSLLHDWMKTAAAKGNPDD